MYVNTIKRKKFKKIIKKMLTTRLQGATIMLSTRKEIAKYGK
nr:MAG TPA: hypothetical protein [Caudoviricetes sp.]